MQTPSVYLHNKNKRKETLFIVNDEGRFYCLKGVMIPEQEFLGLFPLEDKVIIATNKYKGENPDGSYV